MVKNVVGALMMSGVIGILRMSQPAVRASRLPLVLHDECGAADVQMQGTLRKSMGPRSSAHR